MTLHEREVLGAIAGGLLGLMAGGDQESEALGATLAAQAIASTMPSVSASAICKMSRIKIPAGTSALVLLIEHLWARELKGAVRGAGGIPIIQGFLTPEALLMVGAELRAVVEAEDTIALAQAVQGAAILSALATRRSGRRDPAGRGGRNGARADRRWPDRRRRGAGRDRHARRGRPDQTGSAGRGQGSGCQGQRRDRGHEDCPGRHQRCGGGHRNGD